MIFDEATAHLAISWSLEELDRMLAEGQPAKAVVTPDTPDELGDDLVLTAPWSPRGTAEAAVVLSGGDGRVKRRSLSP